MAVNGDPRIIVNEKDESGFVTATNPETCAFNLVTRKGPAYPVYCTGPQVALNWFGEPTPDVPGMYEALQTLEVTPCWITSSLGSGYKYAGVDVLTDRVRGFGVGTGRIPSSFNLSSIPTQLTFSGNTPILGNGINGLFTGIQLPIPAGATFEPSNQPDDFQIFVNSTQVDITSIPSVSGTAHIVAVDLNFAGSTVDDISGDVQLQFNGSPGTPAIYTAPNALVGNVSLAGPKPKAFNLNVDGNLVININVGNSSTNTVAGIVAAINAILTTAGLGNLLSVNGSDRIVITGTIGDPVFGKIQISDPTDSVTYDSAVTILFDSAFIGGVLSQTTASTAPPVGSAIPKNGATISFKYIVTEDLSSKVAFSLFATSPYDDDDFKYFVDVRYLRDRIYQVDLLQELPNIGNSSIYTTPKIISLDKVKDAQGKSIYIHDVFKDDPFIKPIVNSAYVGIADLAGFPVTQVQLTGGERGTAPTNADVFNAWQPFKKSTRFKIKTFVDVYGNSASTLASMINLNQKYAFGITCIPLGYNALNAVAYRHALGINFDGLALYTNWQLIEDTFTGSSGVFTSGMGKVAIKFAQMQPVYDAESPAGIDESGQYGGLIGAIGYKILEMEQHYTADELEMFIENQINPIIADDVNGPIIKGDQTLQVQESDTSFIMHRRLFNYVISNIVEKVLPRQEFRLNDGPHQDKMKALCEDIINPPFVAGYFREVAVVCDNSNNTDEVKRVRQFVIDIFVKVTPNSQRIKLNFTRVSQTTSIVSLVPA